MDKISQYICLRHFMTFWAITSRRNWHEDCSEHFHLRARKSFFADEVLA